jgi:hypothetical protein
MHLSQFVRMDMSNCERRICAFLELAGMAGLLSAICLSPLAVPFIKRHQDAFKPLKAWMAGARFVTDKGLPLQSHTNDCGPVSLKMILSAHGVERSLSDIASGLRLTPKGTSMLDLRLTSAKLGVPAKSWAVRPEDLFQVPLPAIAFINKRHFVVIRKFVTPEILEVDDPALGKVQWPSRKFRQVWSGEILVFDPIWTPR